MGYRVVVVEVMDQPLATDLKESALVLARLLGTLWKVRSPWRGSLACRLPSGVANSTVSPAGSAGSLGVILSDTALGGGLDGKLDHQLGGLAGVVDCIDNLLQAIGALIEEFTTADFAGGIEERTGRAHVVAPGGYGRVAWVTAICTGCGSASCGRIRTTKARPAAQTHATARSRWE